MLVQNVDGDEVAGGWTRGLCTTVSQGEARVALPQTLLQQ